jgi:pyrroline-5-carboxylate reductase
MFRKELGIIGVGKIGAALINRFINTSTLERENIVMFDTNETRLSERQTDFNIEIAKDNVSLVKSTRYILIAVIPQVIDKLLEEIAPVITENHIIVSIAAGVSIEHIESIIKKPIGIIRIMTNVPAIVGAAATVIACNTQVKETEKDFIQKLFNSVGMVVKLNETHMDAVTGLSGSGPAYIFIIIEALADGGVKMGLPRDISQKIAAQTVLGSAKLLLETNRHPGELKDMVATPGGTTITAIHELESAKLRATLIRAVEAATLKSKALNSLSKNNS